MTDNMSLMSSLGRQRMLDQSFLTDLEALRYERQAVTLMRAAMDNADYAMAVSTLSHQLMQLHDLHTTLQSLGSHYLLNEVELFEIKNLAYHSNNARKALGQLSLDGFFCLPDLTEVFDLLDPDHAGIPNFYIYDSYDIRLAPLRRQLKQADDAKQAELIAEQNEIQQQVITHLCDKLQLYVDNLVTAMETMAYIDLQWHARSLPRIGTWSFPRRRARR